jgi:hypothetical protein
MSVVLQMRMIRLIEQALDCIVGIGELSWYASKPGIAWEFLFRT